MASYSNILAWESPWTEEPGGLFFVWSQIVGHDLVTKQQQQYALKMKADKARRGSNTGC